MRRYKYIGPKDLLAAVSSNTEGSVIRSFVDFREWLSIYEKEALEEPFTFVVDVEGNLRLAPRRTEHVACAGRADVLSAGEIWFEPESDGWSVALYARRGLRAIAAWSCGDSPLNFMHRFGDSARRGF